MRLVGYVILLWALALTESNGGALALGIGVVFLLMVRYYRRHGWAGAIATVLVAGPGGRVFFTVVPLNSIRHWALNSNQPLLVNSIGRSAQSSQRAEPARQGDRIALYQRSDGVLGLGPMSTKQLLAQLVYPYSNEAHNDWLAALSERGVLGLFALLLLVGLRRSRGPGRCPAAAVGADGGGRARPGRASSRPCWRSASTPSSRRSCTSARCGCCSASPPCSAGTRGSGSDRPAAPLRPAAPGGHRGAPAHLDGADRKPAGTIRRPAGPYVRPVAAASTAPRAARHGPCRGRSSRTSGARRRAGVRLRRQPARRPGRRPDRPRLLRAAARAALAVRGHPFLRPADRGGLLHGRRARPGPAVTAHHRPARRDRRGDQRAGLAGLRRSRSSTCSSSRCRSRSSWS